MNFVRIFPTEQKITIHYIGIIEFGNFIHILKHSNVCAIIRITPSNIFA